MKKGALKKTIFREILQSKARFFSIFGIILLGVGFYAGIKATGPDMLNTANQYFSEQKLMDLKITSTMGLTSEDVQLVKKDSRIMDYSAEYSKDINNSETNQVIHFVSYNLKQKPTINSYRVIRGRLPEKSGELAIDSAAMESHSYQIGDTFSINEEEREGLKKYEYTIVGEVVSPQYIELFSRGTTNVGKGSIDFFAVIPEEDFDMNVYTELYLRFKDTQSLKAFSKAYDQSVTDNQKRVEKNFKARPKERLTEIKAEGQKKIDSGKQEIQENEKKLTDGEQKLQLAKRSLEDGEVTYSQSVLAFQNEMTANEQKLQDSQQQIAETEQEIENQKDYLENERQKLEQGRQQLFIGEQELAQKNLEWQSQKKTNLEEITNLQQIVVASQELAGSIQGAPQLSDNELLANLSVWETGITRLSEVPEISSQLPVFNEIINQVKVDLSLKNNLLEISAALSQIAVGYQRVLEDSQVQVNQIDQQLAQKQVELEQAAAQINVGEAELQEGQSKIQTAENQLASGKQELNQGILQLEQAKQSGQTQLDSAKSQLEKGQQDYENNVKLFESEKNKALSELETAKKEIEKNQEELNTLEEPTYYFLNRDKNPGYSEYGDNSNRISAIATVFPVFFFLIAALVCLTTMTRMVEEQRGEIGTLKALGYSNAEISAKYVVYATVASLLGSLLGLFIGYRLFPNVIFNAYRTLYNLPSIISGSYINYTLQSIIVALLCTLLSALIVLRVDLFSSPAILMRPKAPKPGKRIFLERVSFIWKRLNFNQKVTVRNLFRYKQRMLMTVLGIAGCMALIITGFGLKNSISDVVTLQLDKIWHYQAVVTYNDKSTKADEEQYQKILKDQKEYKDNMPMFQQAFQYYKKGVSTQEVTLYVPKYPEKESQFMLFNDRKTGKKYALTDDGAIINEKLAKLYQLKVGDSITLTDSDNTKYKLKISKIAENYTMHFAYITPTYYEKVFNKKPVYNSDLLLLHSESNDKDKFASVLMNTQQVLNVSFIEDMGNAMDDTMASLNIVVWVLIVSAALLAFIVLYNLTNINISERIRELSTIKVLGFYNREVTMYIYRENIILTVLGILLGCILGKFLHGFVLQTAEVDLIMFSPELYISSYIYSAALTLLFSSLVMLVMHWKLRKINMIEALKSNE